MFKYWYIEVLYKRFLTPFRDGVSNRRQVSVGDRGVLPTRPRNRWGYALLAHTLGKMRSCATGEHSNTEIRIVELKKIQLYSKIVSGRKYIPHSQSPLNVSVRMYIPHSQSKEYVFVSMYIPHSQSKKYVSVCIYIPHSHSKENISVRRYITHNFPH